MPALKYIDHVQADVLSWPQDLREDFMRQVRVNVQHWSQSEAELRAWIDTRSGEVAKEPVVANRHHLTPETPQRDDNRVWPTWAVYCGRPPIVVKDGDMGWRYARALGNKWSHRDYPDALERYRHFIKTAMLRFKAGERTEIVDAIRSILPRHALVCSCVRTPWVSTAPVNPQEALGPEWTCHCQLVVAAWRVLHKKPEPREVSPCHV